MEAKRITILAGHYGSGKTTLAVHYAIALRGEVSPVTVCDLDIVNPYFRTADAQALLAAHDIRLISSRFANTNVDAPAVAPEVKGVFDDPAITAVIDLGGDDRGALALGRYAKWLQPGAAYDMLLVINPFRPLTRTVADMQAVRAEMEAASKVRFTGMVANPNLGRQTALADVTGSLPLLREASAAMGLPIRFVAVWDALLPAPDTPAHEALHNMQTILPIGLLDKPAWSI